MALAVAGNAVAFGTLERRLYPAFPYPDAERLTLIRETDGRRSQLVRYELAKEIASASGYQALEAVAPYDIRQVGLGSGNPAKLAVAQIVSPAFFRMLGGRAYLGRVFSEGEESEAVAVLQYEVWRDSFGANSEIFGETVVVDGRPYDVIGVMPQGFSFLTPRTGVWVPLDPANQNADTRLNLLVLRKRTASAEQVEAAVSSIAIGSGWVAPSPQAGFRALSLQEINRGPRTVQLLWLLQLSMVAVLLLSAINVGTFQLADTQRRLKDIGIRLLVGATRFSVARLLWVESLLQAAVGGLLGIALALGAVNVLRRRPPFLDLPEPSRPAFDVSVLAASLAFVLIISLIAGVIPVFQATKARALENLNARHSHKTRGGRRLLRYFVGAQIALAVLLVSVTALTTLGFRRIADAPVGFDDSNLLMMGLWLPEERYPEEQQRRDFFERVTSSLSEHPAVEQVAMASSPLRVVLPPATVVNPMADPQAEHSVGTVRASPNYFRALGIQRLLGAAAQDQGQGLLERTASSVVVNEQLAKLLWGDRDPVGMSLSVNGEPRQVSGVVANVLQDLGGPSPGSYGPILYDLLPDGASPRILFLRARDISPSTRRTLVETIGRADPSLGVLPLFTMDEQLVEAFSAQRLAGTWLSGYAALALLLSTVGVFSVTASSAAQRQHEMGVRLTLGATPLGNLLELVRGSARVTLIALSVGLLLSYLAGRMLNGVVVGLSDGFDPILLGSVAAIAIAALVASLVPALRVLGFSPAEVLRSE